MSKRSKTIEAICVSGTQVDMWDELNREIKLSSSIMHLFPPNTVYRLRLLGPFMKAKRIYTGGLRNIIDQLDIKSIFNGNQDAYDRAVKIVNGYFNKVDDEQVEINDAYNRRNSQRNSRTWASRMARQAPQPVLTKANTNPHQEAMSQLDKIFGKNRYWQNCLMVNAICEQPSTRSFPTIQVVALPTSICNNIGNAANLIGTNCKINGLLAHSIEVSKSGHGLNSQFSVNILPESNLTNELIRKIISEGLYDIPTLIKVANRRRYPFIYRLEPNYRMSTEFMPTILEECKKFEENKHLDKTEERIHEIPYEAFEQANNMRDGIGSLEV